MFSVGMARARQVRGAINFQDLFGFSLSLRWPRQCNPVENLAEERSLNVTGTGAPPRLWRPAEQETRISICSCEGR